MAEGLAVAPARIRGRGDDTIERRAAVPSFTIAVGPKLEPQSLGCVSKEVRERERPILRRGQRRWAEPRRRERQIGRCRVGRCGHVLPGRPRRRRSNSSAGIKVLRAHRKTVRVSLSAGSNPGSQIPKPGFDNSNVPETAREIVETEGPSHWGRNVHVSSHVRPDSYQLWIARQGYHANLRAARGRNRDVEIGPHFSSREPGESPGHVYRAGGLRRLSWPLADVILKLHRSAGITGNSFADDRQLCHG